jgi:hypothetical protein
VCDGFVDSHPSRKLSQIDKTINSISRKAAKPQRITQNGKGTEMRIMYYKILIALLL